MMEALPPPPPDVARAVELLLQQKEPAFLYLDAEGRPHVNWRRPAGHQFVILSGSFNPLHRGHIGLLEGNL